MRTLITALVLGLFPSLVYAAPKEEKYGIWIETYRGLNYIVDTKAELCFAVVPSTQGGGGITTIPCEKIALREEWKTIIKWIGAK
jgi:hypothetical protein